MSATDTTDPLAPAARADAYLADVRRHLDERADLGDDERDDLLDELTAHVHEVAASDDRPLDDVLGPPAAFATELLASAGLTSDGSPPRPASLPGWAGTAWQGVAAAAASLRARRWARSLAAFLRELRPAWWVIRGPLIVYGIWLWGDVYGPVHDDASFLPHVFNQKLLGALLLVAAAVISVQLARRTTRRGWVRLVNAAAVAGAIVLWAAAYTIDIAPVNDDGDEPSAVGRYIRHPDGDPITDFYAFDTDGQPIDQVLLYDQHGRPVDVGEPGDPATHRDYVLDTNGVPVGNLYPQHFTVDVPGRPSEARAPAYPPVVPPTLQDRDASPTDTATTTSHPDAPPTTIPWP